MRPYFALLPLIALCLAACAAPVRDPQHGQGLPAGSIAGGELCRSLADPDKALADAAGVFLPALREIYDTRNCAPLWHVERTPTVAQKAVTERVVRITALDPAAGGSAASRLAGAAADGQSWAGSEIATTLAFAQLAVDPETPASMPSAARLAQLAAGAADDAQRLAEVLPLDPQIRRLRAAITAHERMSQAGGWPRLAGGAKLQAGDRDPRVAALRDRLAASGDMGAGAGEAALFDPALEVALQHFQARHGLAADGKLGPETTAALNAPIATRLAALHDNLARRIRQRRDWGPRYIIVNIAAAELALVERDRETLRRRVIVGRPTWQTPELDSVIERLDFNPTWVVPTSIARAEVLPKARRDPGYLERNGMRIVDGQIRQAPGPRNPLGQVKFVFRNSFSVYLHDTNAKDLFARDARFLSHGCVRVNQALDLARRLVAGDAEWPAYRIDAALASGRTTSVDLKRPIPVHLVYDTAWVDTDGAVNFRADVYNLDRPLTAGLGPAREMRCGA